MKHIYLLFSLVHCERIIKNHHLPACKNCIYYQMTYYKDFTHPFSKCEKFGEKDIITNEIKYDYADSCRTDDSKCGEEGEYFQEEKNINMKIWKHKIIRAMPTFLLISPFLFFFTKNLLLHPTV